MDEKLLIEGLCDHGQGLIEAHIDHTVLKLIVEENDPDNTSYEHDMAAVYLTRRQARKLGEYLLRYAAG